jgi:hypothetical protein
MVCVVSATLRRHVVVSVVLEEKIPDTTPTLPTNHWTLTLDDAVRAITGA